MVTVVMMVLTFLVTRYIYRSASKVSFASLMKYIYDKGMPMPSNEDLERGRKWAMKVYFKKDC